MDNYEGGKWNYFKIMINGWCMY